MELLESSRFNEAMCQPVRGGMLLQMGGTTLPAAGPFLGQLQSLDLLLACKSPTPKKKTS